MMSSLFVRRGTRRLYAKLRDIEGVWRQVATGFDEDQRDQAERWVRDREREVERERRTRGESRGPLTVAIYAETWLSRRLNATAKDDRTRITKHVIPRIGHLEIVDVRPRHLRDLIVDLRAEGALAPKTIRQISGLLHSMFKSAVIDEIIAENPAVFERGVLPSKVDKDPTWRHEAIYTRAEVEQLLSDERIPIDRRAFYALKFFTGRHSEVATLTWSQYDTAARPLGAINLGKTKSGVPRQVPVHPTLAKVLAAWKLSGWEDLYGHKPEPTDLIVPTRNLRRRRADEAQKQLLADLDKIGLRTRAGKERNRRGHDLRRTLITLARTDGALDSLLRWITHGPRPSEMLDVYSTPPWGALCAEIGKLKVDLREGKVIALAANDLGATMVQSSKPVESTPKKKRPQRDSNGLKLVGDDAPNQSIRQVADREYRSAPPGCTKLHQIRCNCDAGLVILRALCS
jgi:integrase